TASQYRACSGPCMYAITFNGSPSDSISAPFYDYNSDTIYVGDNAGRLHKFTGVFNGTPAEVTSSPWPVTVASSTISCGSGTNACLTLSSPVYDSTSGKIFVGNGITVNFIVFTGGALSAVTASTGAVASTSQLGHGTG